MHTIVNHLSIKPETDWTVVAATFDAFASDLRQYHPGVRSAQLLKVDEGSAILVITFEDLATLQHVSSNVAGPWFAENVRPWLSGPVSRSVGEMIAGYA